MTTESRVSAAELEAAAQDLESKTPQEVLEWALSQFHPRISLASSFGAEDVVLIDMLQRIDPNSRVFSLDTFRLHKETYDVMDRIREKYGLDLEVYKPDQKDVDDMVNKHGLNLFYESVDNRKLCCGIRKVEPLNRALSELDAWITGLRRDQANTRNAVAKVELDVGHGSIAKINPLADWSPEQVWDYIKANDVPYNALHDQDFPSIGCEPCTRPVKPGEDPRAGRWWWEQEETDKECGLHGG